MERRNLSRTIKLVMLVSALLMMLLLCGCRTRITNNTDVTSTIIDESGVLEQTYQERRDELGEPVAESPLIKGMGSEDEELDYEEFGDPFENSDPYIEDAEDDEEDEEEAADSQSSDDEEGEGGTTTSTSTQRRGSGTNSRPSTTTSTTNKSIKVTLNVNGSGAKCSASSIKVKKGSKYGSLPTPTRSGYTFEGWYTSKTGGNKVTAKTKVTKSSAHTLYAHWTKSGSGNSEQKTDPAPAPETAKTHKVSFNINCDDSIDAPTDISIDEGGAYPALPTLTRPGYKFLGWETEDGTQITEGTPYSATSDQTLKAIWKSNHDWWNEDFETAANDVKPDERFIVTVDDGDNSEKGLVEECKGQLSKDDDVPDYVVVFIKSYTESSAKDKAESVYDKYKEAAPSVKVIVVSDQALKGSDNEKLLYKMMLFDAMYGEGKDHFDDQRADLDAEGDYPYIYTKTES